MYLCNINSYPSAVQSHVTIPVHGIYYPYVNFYLGIIQLSF